MSQRQVICYIGGTHPTSALDGFHKAIKDYCAANGLPAPKGDNLPEEVTPGPILQEAITAAQPGAVFVTNGLGSFGTKPSEQRTHITALIARGADIHILGIGKLDSIWGTLRVLWDVFGELEYQLNELEKDYAALEDRCRARMAAHEEKLVQRMSEVVGSSSIKAFYGANGGQAPVSDVEPNVEPTDPTALRIKELREARKWSMEELATRAGTTKSMVQRAESLGRCSAMGQIMSCLEHTP
jgi:hypothetical protein